MSEHIPRYASMRHPTIEAVTSGLFRFPDMESARERLNMLRQQFILSRHQPEDDPDAMVLWIRGYEVSEAEEKKGYFGHYALVSCEPVPDEDGKVTLLAQKLPFDLKFHPQRKRGKHKHPNWGHPVLRGIKRGQIFFSVEEAQAELMQLHEEYPDVSIPCTNKLYIIVYSKAAGKTPPVQKYVLETKVAEDGGFYIEARENDYQPPATTGTDVTTTPPPADGEDAESDGAPQEEPTKGYFASMVELKRSRKKGYTPPPAEQETEGGE